MNKTVAKIVVAAVLPLLAVSAPVKGAGPLELNQAGTLQTVDLPASLVPDINNLASTFSESTAYSPTPVANWTPVDPSLIGLSGSTQMAAWLVGGVASFKNEIGYNVNGFNGGTDFSLNNGDPAIIFQDASPTPDDIQVDAVNTPRVIDGPIGPGKLDFYLLADTQSAGGPKNLYWTDLAPGKPAVTTGVGANVNPDGLQHALAFLHSDGVSLMYAWEDLPQLGDSDFNDVFMLVRARGIVIIPEPATYLMMGTLLLVALWAKRRREMTATA